MSRKINEIGRSMVEMIGYMAVAMSVIVAIGKIVTNAFNEHKFSQASIQLSDLATAISKAGAIEKDYSAVDFNQHIPESYRVAGNSVFHVFGGSVVISALNSEKDKFSITFYGLKRRQCIELGMKDWRHNQNVDLFAVGVNGVYLYWPVYSGEWDENGDDSVHTYSKTKSTDNDGNEYYEKNDGDEKSLPMKRGVLAGTSDDASDKGLCDKETGNFITWIFN